jgi:hypothetical protein
MDLISDQESSTTYKRYIEDDSNSNTFLAPSHVTRRSYSPLLDDERSPESSTLFADSPRINGSYSIPEVNMENKVNEKAKLPSRSRLHDQEGTMRQTLRPLGGMFVKAFKSDAVWARLVYGLVGILLAAMWVCVM